MLLKEIAYWTYYLLSKNKSYGKSADTMIQKTKSTFSQNEKYILTSR